MWGFSTVRAAAIAHLSTIPLKAVEKLVLAHTYHVTEWLLPALNQLAQQESLLEDAQRIAQVTNWEYVMKLTKVRESMNERPNGTGTAQGCGRSQGSWRCNVCHRYSLQVCGSDYSTLRNGYDFTPIICTIFEFTN
jgi:hypothetical protein